MFAEHKLRRGAAGIDFSYNGVFSHAPSPQERPHVYPAVDIGTPNIDRIVAVLVATFVTSNVEITSILIGGVTANLFEQTGSAGHNNAIAWLKVPTGTSVEVVVNLSNEVGLAELTSYSFNLLNDNAIDTVKSSGTTVSRTLADMECREGGVVLALWTKAANSTSAPTASWNGVDQPTEDLYGSYFSVIEHGSYSIQTTENSTTNDFTVTSASGSGKNTLMAISFGEL